jgi:hypothetical protein
MSWLTRALIPVFFAFGFGLMVAANRLHLLRDGHVPRYVSYLVFALGILIWGISAEVAAVIGWVAIGGLWGLLITWHKTHPINAG